MFEGLFKAKRKDNGEWIEGVPYFGITAGLVVVATIIPVREWNGQKVHEFSERVEVEEETISPWIGKTDVHGKKIFAGDIIRMSFPPEDFGEGDDMSPEYLTVYWDGKLSSFLCKSDMSSLPTECDSFDLQDDGTAVEVVDSIFDEPRQGASL